MTSSIARYLFTPLSIIALLSACETAWGGDVSPIDETEDLSVVRQALSSDPPDSDCKFDIYNGHEYFN